MNEYPLLFYFLAFLVLIFFSPKLGLILFVFLFFLLGLYGHRIFGLFLERYSWERYPHVFILPFGRNAYVVGDSILVGKGLLSSPHREAILFHELAHVKFRDWTSVFLLLLFYRVVGEFLKGKEFLAFAVLYGLLFFWFYWHMEVRADMFSKMHGQDVEKALQDYGLNWRLSFLKGKSTSFQEKAIVFVLVFLAGLYLGYSYKVQNLQNPVQMEKRE